MKLDGYIRVSHVGGRGGASFISPKMQREEIEAWARFRGVEILRFHTDLDQSGAKIERPGLKRALERAESGKSDGILVAKLDRFARSLTGALEAIKRLDEAGAVFVSVAEGLDPTTPAGKMLMRLMLVMAEFELDRVRENWDQSRRRAVARGLHLSAKPPAGYRRRRGGRLVLDPEMAPHVAHCYRMRAERRPWGEIIPYASAHQIRTFRGSTHWTAATFKSLIENRANIGEARSGNHVQRGAHQPLIDRGTWEVAQLVRTLVAGRNQEPPLLAGLVRCAGCRYVMFGHRGCGANLGKVRKYECKNRSPGGCPQCCSVQGAEIEEFVTEEFFRTYNASNLRRAASARSIAKAERALLEAEDRLQNLRDRLDLASELGEEDLAAARERTESRRLRLIELTRSRLLPSPARLHRSWTKYSITERRRYISLLMDAVFVRADRNRGLADRLLVLPFGDRSLEMPMPGMSARIAFPSVEWGMAEPRLGLGVGQDVE